MVTIMGVAVYRISIFESNFFNPFSCIFTGLFVFAVLYFSSLYYVLTDKEIQIHILWGIIGKPVGRIFISAITSVERSYFQINMGLSLKQLRLRFKKGYKWDKFFNESSFFVPLFPSISPVREQEFLETLKTINPDIQINVTDKKGWWRFWDWDF